MEYKNFFENLENNNMKEISEVILEFFWNSIDFLWYFWSISTWNDSIYSDIDFIILLNWNISQEKREFFSPKLKDILSKKWITQLSAFNIYNTNDFLNSPEWFQTILKNNLKTIYDNIFFDKIWKNWNFIKIFEKWWKTSNSTLNKQLYERSIRLSKNLKEIWNELEDFQEFREYYYLEWEILRLLWDTLNLWHLTTIYQFEDLYNILNVSSRLKWREKDYKRNYLEEKIFFDYSYADKNSEISKKILNKNKVLSLKHILISCHILMREILHNNNYFIVDWEITQAFFKKFIKENKTELKNEYFYKLIKAEQIVWRSWVITFDLDNNIPLFAEDNQNNIQNLIIDLNNIYEELKKIQLTENNSSNQTLVSIVIPSFNRFESLLDSFNFINNLVFPNNKIEVIVVNDWSTQAYDIDKINSKFKLKMINKEHSWITDTRNEGIKNAQWEFILFLDDDIKISPLTLLRLLFKWQNQNVGITWVKTLGIPEKWFISEYSHNRWLLSWPVICNNEIVNIPTCCALVKKEILEIIWNFSVEQWKEWITFWWEDVDLSYRLTKGCFNLEYNNKAIVYHKHRNNLKQLIKQHIWYWEWTAFHCLEQNRDFSEIWIPEPTYYSIFLDILKYIKNEIPKRILRWVKEEKDISKIIWYPILDLIRKVSYDVWVIRTRNLYINKK